MSIDSFSALNVSANEFLPPRLLKWTLTRLCGGQSSPHGPIMHHWCHVIVAQPMVSLSREVPRLSPSPVICHHVAHPSKTKSSSLTAVSPPHPLACVLSLPTTFVFRNGSSLSFWWLDISIRHAAPVSARQKSKGAFIPSRFGTQGEFKFSCETAAAAGTWIARTTTGPLPSD